jgi:hypothetical protein
MVIDINAENLKVIVENNQFEDNLFLDFAAGVNLSNAAPDGGTLCFRLNGNQSFDDLQVENDSSLPGIIFLKGSYRQYTGSPFPRAHYVC